MAKKCPNVPLFQISAIKNYYKGVKNPHVLHDFTDGAVEDTEGSWLEFMIGITDLSPRKLKFQVS